eukprot:maker-scaffold449_size167299-snap-gene-0.15 protein:Tk10588 transcript:maker-scaffold449_size167299-snap-gene-0.15-mRNA-1 annotation:"hypothetical protein DAPPUDRAFT_337297"
MEEEVVSVSNTSIVWVTTHHPVPLGLPVLTTLREDHVDNHYNLSVASSGISCNGASSGNPSLLTQNDSLFGGEGGARRSSYRILQTPSHRGDVIVKTRHDEDSIASKSPEEPSDLSVILSRKSSLILEPSRTSLSRELQGLNQDEGSPKRHQASEDSLKKSHLSNDPDRIPPKAYESQEWTMVLGPEGSVVECSESSVIWRCSGGPFLRKVRRRIQSRENLLTM